MYPSIYIYLFYLMSDFFTNSNKILLEFTGGKGERENLYCFIHEL
jgi:hypothetical protein